MKTNKVLKSTWSILTLTLLLFVSCTEENIELENITLQEQVIEITPVVQKLMDMGYDLKNIVVSDNFYIVEGDLAFSKNIKDYSNTQNHNSRQAHSDNLVHIDNNQAREIKVYSKISETDGNIINPEPNYWEEAVDRAIEDWNTVIDDFCIRFVTVEHSYEADIMIISDEDSFNPNSLDASGYLGLAGIPTNNLDPYPYIWIDLESEFFEDSEDNALLKSNLITHELGHCIGFRHTDQIASIGGYNEIPNMPESDPASVMNSIISEEYVSFSYHDKIAIAYLYGDCENIKDPKEDPIEEDEEITYSCPTNLELFASANCEDVQAWINVAPGVDYVDFYYALGTYDHVYFGTSHGNQSSQFAAPLYMPEPPLSGSWNGYTLSVYAVAVMNDGTICEEILVREKLSCGLGNWW